MGFGKLNPLALRRYVVDKIAGFLNLERGGITQRQGEMKNSQLA